MLQVVQPLHDHLAGVVLTDEGLLLRLKGFPTVLLCVAGDAHGHGNTVRHLAARSLRVLLQQLHFTQAAGVRSVAALEHTRGSQFLRRQIGEAVHINILALVILRDVGQQPIQSAPA